MNNAPAAQWQRHTTMRDGSHEVTPFEIFFDLVFVFAITRVIDFMAHRLTALTLVQGLVLLLLLWWSWVAFVWLGNRVQADQGLVRASMLTVMAALFVAALVMPEGWSSSTGQIDAPLVLAITFTVVRLVYFWLQMLSTGGDKRLRTQLLIDAIPQTVAQAALIAGAILGDNWQLGLWISAFVIDFGGGRIASRAGGWTVGSPSHFAERHRLVLIIALGESIVSAGAGVGISVTRPIVLIAATIGFVAVVSMWFLYFERVAEAAEEALDLSTGARRAELARDGYTLVHFFLIAGVLYAALGIREVLAISSSADSTNQVATLPWPAVVSLYGGAIVYLVGRATFMWLTLTIAPLAQFAVAGALLALMPLARRVSAWAGLLVVSVALVALVALERWTTYRALRGHLDQGRPVETS